MRRIIKLFKGSGILNLLGMTVAFASLYILLVQVYYDLSYNKGIKDCERVYIMAIPSWYEQGKFQVSMNRPVSSAIASNSPMVESYGVARIYVNSKSAVLVGEGEQQKVYNLGVSELTRGALDVFSFEPVAGTFDGMEVEPTAAICESAAALMGVGVGDFIRFKGNEGEPIKIAAVYKDMPLNSDFGNVELFFCDLIETQGTDNWSEWGFHSWVKLCSADQKQAFEQGAVGLAEKSIREFFGNIPDVEQEDVANYVKRATVTLIPLDEMYFNNCLENHDGRSGNKTTTITLLLIAILIVVVTLINFVNFFFAQVPMRIKEVNTRKVLGSSRGLLVFRFMMESGFLVLVSLCAAVAVVVLFKSSTYANLISCSLEFKNNIPVIPVTILVALVMTIASSVYPALYITSFPLADALKGSYSRAINGKKFRYALIALQFIISMSFVISLFCIKKQYSFMMNYDMGFNKEYLLTTNVPIGNYNARETISNEVLKSVHVRDIAWGAGPLVNTVKMGWGRSYKEEEIAFDSYPVSWNFLKFMGIEVLEGRDFTSADEKSENGVFIFNQVAKKKFGLVLGDKIQGHKDPTEIAGFCEDIIFRPLQYEITPLAFYVFGNDPWWQPTHMYIRCAAGSSVKDVTSAIADAIHKIAPLWPVENLDVNFFDKELGRQYEKEKNLTKIVALFTFIAIIISLMGVLGMVIFETQYRRKEIGVRRVHGATVGEILRMFNIKFTKLLLGCFVVASAISWAIADYYYSTFAYSTKISVWIFVLSFLFVAMIVWVVVTVASLKVAMENPVDSLKNE